MSYEIKIGGFIPKHIEKCVILQFASVHFIITNKLSKSQEQLREWYLVIGAFWGWKISLIFDSDKQNGDHGTTVVDLVSLNKVEKILD